MEKTREFYTDEAIHETKIEIINYLKTKNLSVYQITSALSEVDEEVRNSIKEKVRNIRETTIYK